MSSAKKLRSAVALLLTLVLTLTMFTFPASVSALGLSKTSITLTKGYATTLTDWCKRRICFMVVLR